MAVLGLCRMGTRLTAFDYGVSSFLLSLETPVDGKPAQAGNGIHIPLAAQNRGMVDRFHAAALAHGGIDVGAPGLRSKYHAHDYGAFASDPDGNKLEAVTHAAE